MGKHIIMKTKNSLIDPKKIPYYIALTLLTTGASLILGFLSFGGMYALLPILPLAFAAFGLSVAYEGEIYLQNIKGAFNKLFKRNYLKNHLAREYLLEHFPENTDDCPEFFKDYEKQLKLVNQFNSEKLTEASKKQKKQQEKILKDMEKWFALQLFATKDDPQTSYSQELREWLTQNQQAKWQAMYAKRKLTFHAVKAFSLLSATFMGLGTTYLVVEAFSVIPIMAAIPFALWPFIIIPMALIAGAAYGMLTYNTVTDLINNDTLNKWYQKIRADFAKGVTVRNVFIATMAVLLVGLAVALTICTAGTWWTVAKNARPLFAWMSKIPGFVMGIINPIITGASAIFFNIENTSESLQMVDAATKSGINIFKSIFQSLQKGFKQLGDTENWLQILNPFRLILKLTITPLRILFFLGHLISIALTADRMPGIPQIVSALIALISEGFEDAHYFIDLHHDHDHSHDDHKHGHGHTHHHHHGDESCEEHNKKNTVHLLKKRLGGAGGHSHDADIPTKILKILVSPVYFLAAVWDYLASKMNRASELNDKGPQPITFKHAFKKQFGLSLAEEVDVPVTTNAQKLPSTGWKVTHAISLIEKFEAKHLNRTVVNSELAQKKKDELDVLKERITSNHEGLAKELSAAKNQAVFNQPRFFSTEKTRTQAFIDELPERINATI